MPYAPKRKQDTRQRIVRSAARLFNRKGFAEATIGEIMTAAGLTAGGFYRHFDSKEELYAEAVRQFIRKGAPEPWQTVPAASCGPNRPFARNVVEAYLSPNHLGDLDGSCPLIGLSSDVARAGQAVRTAYRDVAEAMIHVFKSNLDGPEAREQALILVALCVGGMVLARGLDSPALADEIRNAVRGHVLATAGWRDG
jgi:AcrR family transcriptional regulator